MVRKHSVATLETSDPVLVRECLISWGSPCSTRSRFESPMREREARYILAVFLVWFGQAASFSEATIFARFGSGVSEPCERLDMFQFHHDFYQLAPSGQPKACPVSGTK